MYTQQYIITITQEKTQRQHLFLYVGVILNIKSEMSLFLNTYVLSEDKFYIYKSTGWTPVTYVATAGSWGTIGGDITTQLDLYTILNSKFEKSGGNISGNTTVFGNITATNIILAGSTPSISLIYTTPPSTSNSAGAVNNISFDTNFFYICVNTNLWKRIPLLSW